MEEASFSNHLSLIDLESLCDTYYSSEEHSQDQREMLESSLNQFFSATTCIGQCIYILNRTRNQYAQMLASTILIKYLSFEVSDENLHTLMKIRNYVIEYLTTSASNLELRVIKSLSILLCRVTKVGWMDDEKFREIVQVAKNFLAESHEQHRTISLCILHQLVIEINQQNGLDAIRHRRTASSFRNRYLSLVSEASLIFLFYLRHGESELLQSLSLTLFLECLLISNEIDTQIPAIMKHIVEYPTLQTLFDYYKTQKAFSKEALKCLLCFASSRRSLFTDATTRVKFLSQLMQGTYEILQGKIGLDDDDNYHAFCQLLGSFKVNFELSEFVKVEGHPSWIYSLMNFIGESLKNSNPANHIDHYYLLNLWCKIAMSAEFLGIVDMSELEEFVSANIRTFVLSRFQFIQPGQSGEDPLDNVVMMQDQLEFFPYLCTFQYKSCYSGLMGIIEPIIESYMNWNPENREVSDELSVMEAKLAWFTHIAAAILKTRQMSGLSGALGESLDVDISAKMLALINISDSGNHNTRYGEVSKQRFDRAILIFLQQLKCFVDDRHIYTRQSYYDQLSELNGLGNHLQLLDLIVEKIATNLKCYTKCKVIIDDTLSFFMDMASGHMMGGLLKQLDNVRCKFLNQMEQFPFLKEREYSRSRTTLFCTFGTLVFMEDNHEKFKSFMEPLLEVFSTLQSRFDDLILSDDVKYALIGLICDLRGIAMSSNSPTAYGLFFDWLHPHMPILLSGLRHYPLNPEVTNPLLKFVAELVLKKSQRLNFHSSSANGILLFRIVSKLIVEYGSEVLDVLDNEASKYKGISICLTILARALSANLVDFEILELYGDKAYSDALDIIIKLVSSIPLEDIFACQKLAASYFTFLETICNGHLQFLLNLDETGLKFIFDSLELGIKNSSENIPSQCASAIGNIGTFHWHQYKVGKLISSHADHILSLSSRVLRTLFEVVVWEDRCNLWTFSGAILSMAIVSEEEVQSAFTQISNSFPLDRRNILLQWFPKLFVGVMKNLDAANRDKFSRILTRFKSDCYQLKP